MPARDCMRGRNLTNFRICLKMIIKANCKINLGLNVLRKRDDGYHELETVMYPVRELYDIVDVEPTESGISLTTTGIEVDCPMDKNLCVRAARLMQERYGVGGVDIKLEKRVPFGAGLGGGSSDATAVIIAINRLYGLGLEDDVLASIAAELGSDTPFFVYNRAMLCRGRGEIMSEIDVNLKGLWLVVAKPKCGVSTAEAYRGVKASLPEVSLTERLQAPIEAWQGSVVNDFEPNIFMAHRDIADIKLQLLNAGAIYASMSGSGSALFGLFKEPPQLRLPDEVFLHVERVM